MDGIESAKIRLLKKKEWCHMSQIRIERALLWITILLASAKTSLADPEIWEKTVRSTVWVVTDMGSGSGVVVSKPDGTIVVATAHHVIEDAGEIHCYFPQFDDSGAIISDRDHYETMRSEAGISATLLNSDPRRDLALLQLNMVPANLAPIKLASIVRPGEEVHCLGNSSVGPLFGYAFGHVRGVSTPSHKVDVRVSDRIFRSSETTMSFDGPVDAQYIISDAAINEGDSGGAAVRWATNGEPELVGLAQSYGEGRLISNLVHAAELAAFLREDKPTIDNRVQEMLDELAIDYEIGSDGRFVASLNSNFVFIESTTFDESAKVREIWAPIADTNGLLSAESASVLLESNSRLRRGRFQIRRLDDSSVTAFSIEIPVDIDPVLLIQEMQFVVDVAETMRERASELPGEYGPLPRSPHQMW